MKPHILKMTPFMPEIEGFLEERFIAHRLPEGEDAQHRLLEEVGPAIGGIATTAVARIGESLFARLPALRIVACQGAGLDNIDVAAAGRRGIRVTGTSHVLAGEVADVGLALILCVMRRLCEADRFVRAGRWPAGGFPLGRSVRGRRLGILGLGTIGGELARRAAVLGMEIGYSGPRPKSGVSYPYFATPLALAEWSDVLAVCCPGGEATRRIVDGAVLAALGPQGYLVNIARGSIVDEPALVAALAEGRLGGAGLDVFENEPRPAEALLTQERAVLLPHIASAAVETRIAMGLSMAESIAQELST